MERKKIVVALALLLTASPAYADFERYPQLNVRPQIYAPAPIAPPPSRYVVDNYLNAEANRANAEASYLRERTIDERSGIYRDNPAMRSLMGSAIESERNARGGR